MRYEVQYQMRKTAENPTRFPKNENLVLRDLPVDGVGNTASATVSLTQRMTTPEFLKFPSSLSRSIVLVLGGKSARTRTC